MNHSAGSWTDQSDLVAGTPLAVLILWRRQLGFEFELISPSLIRVVESLLVDDATVGSWVELLSKARREHGDASLRHSPTSQKANEWADYDTSRYVLERHVHFYRVRQLMTSSISLQG